MSDFVASMYHITRAGRHVTGGIFDTAEAIFDHIRRHRAGVYSVYREQPPGQESSRKSEFWGDVAHFGAGKIFFDSDSARS